MPRPDSPQHHGIRYLNDRIVVWLLLAPMLSVIFGCNWIQRKQGYNQELCRDCIEQSFTAQQTGNLEQARQHLEKSIKIEPHHAETWWNLAELSIQQDRYSQAIVELKEYLELQPDDPHGYLRLAQLYYLQNEYELAQTALKETIRRIPNNIDAIMLSGRLARKQADHPLAMSAYYHVLQVNPNHAEATLELAEMLLAKHESVQAAAILRGLTRTNLIPEDESRAHLNLGIAYGQTERWEDAVEHLAKADAMTDQPTPRDRYRLAYAHYKAGTSQQALEILLKMADSEHWDSRTENFYATITGTIPQTAYTPSVMSASHEHRSDHPFLKDLQVSPVFATDRLLQKLSETEIDIVPPEWGPK
ncbi:Formate-dependent nitrite reductase complex subunit NrfG [Rubinisphaera italica]|uniref:Formate-dependent nitrite reductase complex subunit NrfG n=1 Tax=Rubinisphaera italica TaxID=2527969 RepID=A0A5C5X8R5_9PLAN|nr:Formate-dependent nitrite reductase complex subunit NrfG [Rubinisphaera italica]